MENINSLKTSQEKFWSGKFGDEYSKRNNNSELIANNISLFSKILKNTNTHINSMLELGSNVGLNLYALKSLLPNIDMTAVEINKQASLELKKIPNIEIHNKSILDFKPTKKYDLVLAKGILIHINQKKLINVYNLLYKSSKKYICISEYYNPVPTEVNYRGNNDVLFKRDFTGEILDLFKNLKLVDYGFIYHRDNNFPQDDATWFLLEK